MIKRIVLTVCLLVGLAALVLGGAAWWVWKQQTELIISTANQILEPWGVEIVSIQGLSTGLQSASADEIHFRLRDVAGNHSINGLRIEYDARELMQGQVQRLQIESAQLRPQHDWLPADSLIQLHTLDMRCNTMDNCSGSAELLAEVSRLQIPDSTVNAEQISFSAQAEVRYQAPVLQMEIPAGLAATLATLNGPAFKLEQPALESQQPWRVNINLEDQLLVADGGYLKTTVPVLRLVTEEEGAPEGLSGFELNIERFNGSYDFSAEEDATSERSWQQRLSAGFSANLEKMYTTVIPYNLWSWRWLQQLEWAPSGNLKLDSVATLDGRQVLTLGITQNFNNREGRATVNTANLNFDPGNLSLSDVLSPLPAETDLIAGELNVEANFQWQMPEDVSSFALEAWQLRGDILTEATGVAGFYEDIAFAGLNTVARWQLAPDLTLNHREPSYLSLGELDPGITLQNLHTRYHYNINARQLALQDSELQVFGGTVRTEPFVLNFAERTDRDAVDSVFNVHIEGLDISQVLSLAAYQQVSASGLIDGTLPVTLKGLTPIVNGGNFNARAPGGSIRYDSGAGMSGNQSLDLVYQALRHYQYESMLATVDYSEEGELLLGMQLQGLSPLLNNGQRINLNLNISDDVPALLQSLQAAENVSERLEDLLN